MDQTTVKNNVFTNRSKYKYNNLNSTESIDDTFDVISETISYSVETFIMRKDFDIFLTEEKNETITELLALNNFQIIEY